KADADGVRQFYGVARYGGQGRGVLYRISEGGVFKALHQLPASWGATGRTPSTTLLEVDGAFYGTTYQGGMNDGGVLFRMSDVDLPPVAQLSRPPSFTAGTLAASQSVPWHGQAQPITIEVFTGVAAWQAANTGAELLEPKPVPGLTDDGIKIRVSNCRNPHVLQFVYREKLAADGTPSGAMYSTSSGESYAFTADPNKPNWHTDAGAGRPNPYYDQAGGSAPSYSGSARIVGPFGLTMFDQPTFGEGLLFAPGARETWRATFKSYVICNCQVVREIHWAREVPWIVDLSGTPTVIPTPTNGKQGPPRYTGVQIVETTDADLAWANAQIAADGFTPITVIAAQ
ncbi:MAG TPA: choice-of-anchor tandem repeat GloVer-containing protein, partial [Gammaproteobacteria bacterium]|nr:choice-of-anchor tandem repeat GloVer-containing protein [Gammaproteobacteria bacterium]